MTGKETKYGFTETERRAGQADELLAIAARHRQGKTTPADCAFVQRLFSQERKRQKKKSGEK
jgi:hypothetical protein